MQKRKNVYRGESLFNYFNKSKTDGPDQVSSTTISYSSVSSSILTTDSRNDVFEKPKNRLTAIPTLQSSLRKCPFYKWIPGTRFTVDAFCYGPIEGCDIYFLSHFHADHYKGLTSRFSGTIYCSSVTKGLLKSRFGDKLNVKQLEMNRAVDICGTSVIAIDANHCPGSVMLLFYITKQHKYILHTGDFRFNSDMIQPPNPLTAFLPIGCQQVMRIHSIFLDNTYCSPEYAFHTQEVVIQSAVEITREFLDVNPGALVFCGMYSIGKERFVYGLASQLHLKVWLPPTQRRLIGAAADAGCELCLKLLQLTVRGNPSKARLHVAPMRDLCPSRLLANNGRQVAVNQRQALPIIAWRPTGWSFKPASASNLLPPGVVLEHKIDHVTIYGAAYSEHSSYTELESFISGLQPKHVQQTVFGGAAKHTSQHVKKWLESAS